MDRQNPVHSEGIETILCDTIVEGTCQNIFVRTQRMYNTRAELDIHYGLGVTVSMRVHHCDQL